MAGGIQGAGRKRWGDMRGGGSCPSSLPSSWDIMGVCRLELVGGAGLARGGARALGAEPARTAVSAQSGPARDRRVEAMLWSGGVDVAIGPRVDTGPADAQSLQLNMSQCTHTHRVHHLNICPSADTDTHTHADAHTQLKTQGFYKTCTLHKQKTYEHNPKVSPFGIALIKYGNKVRRCWYH